MKAENLVTKSNDRKYLNRTLFAMGVLAVTASAWVAWPALVHLGGKLV